MAVLPLSASDVERTRLPLERASQLPGAAFTDPDVLHWEVDQIFKREWVCAGHIDQVNERGKYLMVEVGDESVLVIADDDGLPRAFRNRCRHRGSRLVDDGEGQLMRLQCPYHAWSYGFDGSLKNAPHTDDIEDFDKTLLRPPARPPRGDRGPRAASTSPARRRRPPSTSATSPPTWPATATPTSSAARGSSTTSPPTGRRSPRTTASACTAPACTPSSTGSRTTSRASRSPAPARWCGGSMVLTAGGRRHDGQGRRPRPPADQGLTEEDLRLVVYYLVFPNALVSLHPDYVMLHTLWPKANDRTEVVCEWFFEPETMATPGLRPQRRRRVLGPGQPGGLGRLLAHPARHGGLATTCPAATRARRPRCTSSTSWSPTATSRRSSRARRSPDEHQRLEPQRAPLRRHRRRRRAQRPHRRRLPRARRPARLHPRAPRRCSAAPA